MKKRARKRLPSAVRACADDGPTPERMAKDDYEPGPDKRPRRVNTLLALRQAGKIDSEAESTAMGWLADYVLARDGYCDPPDRPRDPSVPRGDVHTWAIVRARAGERIRLMQQAIGIGNHIKLELMLVQGLSFRAMARCLYPNRTGDRAVNEVSVACATILTMLPGVYWTVCQAQRARQGKRYSTESHVAGPSQQEMTSGIFAPQFQRVFE